jgi:hypothetical protein
MTGLASVSGAGFSPPVRVELFPHGPSNSHVLCRFFDGYRVSHAREPLYVAFRNAFLPPLVEITGAELFVGHFVSEYVGAHDEYLVADGDEGLLLPPSGHKAVVFRPEAGALHPRGDPPEFGQYGLELLLSRGWWQPASSSPRSRCCRDSCPTRRTGASRWGRGPCSPPARR